MAKRCCVPNCNVSRYNSRITLHSFPNPETDITRFRSWLHVIGGEVLALDNAYIYKYRRVCHNHFETKYHTWTNTLSPDAVPTLELTGSPLPQRAMSDITLRMSSNQNIINTELPSTSKDISMLCEAAPVSKETSDTVTPAPISSSFTLKRAATSTKVPTVKNLERVIKKLKKKNDSYVSRLKKALKLSENETFQKCLKKFSTLAAMFTVMQFREIPKDKMGRRFTKEEKIMALSLYKQGPKAYRWLSKLFVLPSPVTLSRLISQAQIKPGINKKLFKQLKKRVQGMPDNHKLCILLFDEIAISPHFDYNQKKDSISGFVTNGKESKRQVADHALVFMLRGVLKNYKQPIAYTFCRGTTPQIELKNMIKNIIAELQACGLTVLATVCDQGTTNVSAINSLVNDTRADYIKNNKEFRHHTFEVNGKEIIPLYDPPHLIKGIRNNFLTKNLKCYIDNCVKIAKWDHILQLYNENPAYKGIKLIKNLTEIHVNPKKISKMKVKYATQIFSKTVASNIGYLADKGVLSEECKDTADVLLFFDDLFDSMNGSYLCFKNKNGKPLLGPVTPKSEHSQVWKQSKKVLQSMKFVTKGREGSVPSINNWIHTLDNSELLKEKLCKEFSINSFWMRHLNQDPLENFFGCIRSHGYRNISPTPSGFEVAFTSLLINNMSSNHSPGSNCEDDLGRAFQSMDYLLSKKDIDKTLIENIELDYEDINCEIVDFDDKKRDARIIAQLNYVTGYILRQAKRKIFKNCSLCRQTLFDNKGAGTEYLKRREYSNKPSLTYPSEKIVKLFSEIQDVVTYILENKSNKPQIRNYIRTILYTNINFNDVTCNVHQQKLVDYIFDLCSRFFIYNWCKETNRLLSGTVAMYNGNDKMKQLSLDYYKKRNKNVQK